MPEGSRDKFSLLSTEANWAEKRLKAELALLEPGELVYGRRHRGRDWEDTAAERIADVKSQLIALNIKLNLRFAEKKRA